MKAMLYVIGISFTGEMGVKGLYEKTIGRLTEWIRGRKPTPEDVFAHKVADDYAAFLRQTPWYEFPFGKTLEQFWRETSWSTAQLHPLARAPHRAVDGIWREGRLCVADRAGRRAVAREAHHPQRHRGHRSGARRGRIKLIERRADGTAIVETPRYRAFTRIILGVPAGGDEGFMAQFPATTRSRRRDLSEGELKGLPQASAAPLQCAVAGEARLAAFRDRGAGKGAWRVGPVRRKQGNAVFEHAYDY